MVGIKPLSAFLPWAPTLARATILLADDHPGFPLIEEQLLKGEFDVVGVVYNGHGLYEAAMRLKPDVIVTDISMPVMSGIDAVGQLMDSGCTSRIVFLTVHTDYEFVRRCLSTGALGYVVKPRMLTDLVRAIREVLAGHVFVSEHLADQESN
jgi:DNA-binding NarL/FixJ family response regulator